MKPTRVDVPHTLSGGRIAAIARLNGTAATRDWFRTAHITAEDSRVLWTIHDDHVSLYYHDIPDDTEA